jgi:transposase InsO family protein
MNIVDDFTRECLAVDVGFSFGSHDAIRCFEDLGFERSFPGTIRFDNGSEFTSHAMLRWGAERNIKLHFIQPGKPTQNAKIESLNGRIRDELLNMRSFVSIRGSPAGFGMAGRLKRKKAAFGPRLPDPAGVRPTGKNDRFTIIRGLKLPHTSPRPSRRHSASRLARADPTSPPAVPLGP